MPKPRNNRFLVNLGVVYFDGLRDDKSVFTFLRPAIEPSHQTFQPLLGNMHAIIVFGNQALLSRRDKQSARLPPSPSTVHHLLRNLCF